jgi:hypothetical protein
MCAFSRSRLESRCGGLVVVSVLVAIGASCGSVSSTQPPPPPPPPPTFTTTTSQEGSLLVMQNQTDTETVRIALQTNWGGSAVELSLKGTNLVNEHDTGRKFRLGSGIPIFPARAGTPHRAATSTTMAHLQLRKR